jgi:hypothetical protein
MRLTRRIVAEVWLPTLGALIWGALIFYQQSQKNLVTAFGATATAFFLIFFFQGQVLRIRKNIRDEDNDQRTYQGVTSINDAVSEIRFLIENRLPRPTSSIPANDFFDSAERALEIGLFYSAAITAAQGFEHEAREIAEISLARPMRRPLGQILAALRIYGSDGTHEQLALLNRTRNTLIHETSPATVTKEQAQELVAGFKDGVEVLRSILL